MENWNLTSVGLVLIGCSITAAGTIIAALILGISIHIAPYLLVATALLIVMSAILVIYGEQKSNGGQ
ncbi:MAG: hypothetical protein WC626_10425 [Methanoregula sp.]